MRNKQQLGFNLVELMIAMVIGLIVLLGLGSIFTTSNILNKAQTGLATMQENGRFAISKIKRDMEVAGRQHCASLALPDTEFTVWSQGPLMNLWQVDDNVSFANGLPARGEIHIDADNDQLPDSVPFPAVSASTQIGRYPLDPSYFIRGSECESGACDPDLGEVGMDALTNFRTVGIADGNRADNTDILTVRYLEGGTTVRSIVDNTVILENSVGFAVGDAIIGDCLNTLWGTANWGGSTVTFTPSPDYTIQSLIKTQGNTKVYSANDEFKTVSYFVGIDADDNQPDRMISSLYRSENGNNQQLVQGVERFDVFYLAQTQTGHVVRLTADQVGNVVGGDSDGDTVPDGPIGCIHPPRIKFTSVNEQMANGPGCLWRSIYAIEIHLLLNTVNDSSVEDNDRFVYSPDGLSAQNPSGGLASGLDGERMHRKEFTAIVPVRGYTL